MTFMLTASTVFSASINNVKITSRPWTLSCIIEITYRKKIKSYLELKYFQPSYCTEVFLSACTNQKHGGVILQMFTWDIESPLVSGGRIVMSITLAVAMEGTVTINRVEGMCRIWRQGRINVRGCSPIAYHNTIKW